MDHGPGLLEPFLNQLWSLLKGVGRRARAVVRGSRTLVDGLMDLMTALLMHLNTWVAGLMFFNNGASGVPALFEDLPTPALRAIFDRKFLDGTLCQGSRLPKCANLHLTYQPTRGPMFIISKL